MASGWSTTSRRLLEEGEVNPTLYDVLGVSPDADPDEIKTAWRDAAERFEPGTGASSAQFHLFNQAAEVLLDPARRSAYDAQLAVDIERSSAASIPPAMAYETNTNTEPATETPDVGPGARSPDSPGRVIRFRIIPFWALGVLALLAVLAMASAIYLFTDYQRASAYEEALDQAPSSAERAAEAILSYDYESLDSDRDAASRFLTSDYSDEYGDTFDSLVRENATATRAKVEAEVLASSSMLQSGDESPDRIPVLLFVNQTTLSTANSGEPTLALNRVRLDMVNIDGTWLVDHITSY